LADPRGLATSRGAPGDVRAASPEEALVLRLVAVIGGEAPREDAHRLLAPGLVCHMDRYTVRGTDVWFDWIDFLLSSAEGNVTVEVDRVVTNPDATITVVGWLRCARSPLASRQEHAATYRVEQGRIAEIWTTRRNYEMIFGAKARHPLLWWFVLLRMAVWRRLPWRRRPR
jgi:hypothetical protein